MIITKIIKPLYLADFNKRTSFQVKRLKVDIICAGDSITGYNNWGPVQIWPVSTYPEFLQILLPEHKIANCGVAGQLSDEALKSVRDYLKLFPNSAYFIIGYGTNDLGLLPNTEIASKMILRNLETMASEVQISGKKPILINIPYINKSFFNLGIARMINQKRNYHNPRLQDFCNRKGILLIDICSHLKDEYFHDNLHPNEKGAEIIANEVARVFS